MNCLLNSRLTKYLLFTLTTFFIFFVGALVSCSYAAGANVNSNPFDETVRILERWTSAHWGRDCFVWVVHYPRDLIDPWVSAETIKSGMSEAEQAAYRRTFISDLKLDSSETFLISIYSFGVRPISLSPVRDNVALITSSGERIKPTRYDSSLDYPSGGVVQGLVFFPKQNSKNFMVALRGMGTGDQDERIFSFGPPEFTPEEKKPEVVVVNLPKKKTTPKKTVTPKVETPPPPPVPVIPPRPIQPIFNDDSKDMADFVNSLRNRGTASQDAASKPKKANINSNAPKPSNIDNAYLSREHVLRNFLSLWSANNSNEMYEMLSDASKRVISRENFAKEVSKASDFRSGLKGEYNIEWVGEERAKVITNHRVLVFKSLVSRTLGVIREGSAWKIVW